MQNNKNKGVSLIEIVIAVAIFIVLMAPIVSALISAMKNSTRAKTIQYRNDYAGNIIEYAKQAPVDDLVSGAYLEKMGSVISKKPSKNPDGTYQPDAETYGKEVLHDNASGKDAEYEWYRIKGSVNLGTKKEKHSYVMEISSKEYAKKELANAAYANPNNTKTGVVEDIDSDKVALINGTIANYDKTVSSAFLAKKINALRENSPVKYEQYISQVNQVDIFSRDTGTRIITVKVKGDKTSGYKVSCTLSYYDNSNVDMDNGQTMHQFLTDPIEYTPYTKEFEVLPDIYLMYNACVYNGSYVNDDYIVFDTDGVTDDTPVHAFIVETAEKYSDTIKNVIAKEADSLNSTNPLKDDYAKLKPDDSLVYEKGKITHGRLDRYGVKIHLAATKADDSNLHVYHNLYNIPKYDNLGNLIDPLKTNTKNDNLSWKNDITLYGKSYKGIVQNNVGTLNEASQEKRGMYTIKVWMDRGDNVDTSREPIISDVSEEQSTQSSSEQSSETN